MDFRARVLHALGWATGPKLLGQLVSWAITLVVVRLLAPGDYGLMAMATVFIAFLTLLNELGLGAALVQTARVDDSTLRQVFGVVLAINACFFVAMAATAPLVAAYFEEPRLTAIVRVIALQFVLMAFAIIPQSLLERNLDFKRRSIVDLAASILGALVTLFAALGGAGVWSLVAGSMSTLLARTVGLNVIAPFLQAPSFALRGLRHTLSFGGLVTADRVLWFLYSQSDVFIVGKLLGKEALGVYSVAMLLATLPMEKFSASINQVAFSAFSRIQSERERVTSSLLKSIRLLAIASIPVFAGISAVGPVFAHVALGSQWATIGLPIALISVVTPLRMFNSVALAAAKGLGRPDVSVSNLVVAIVVMPAAFLIGSRWGLNGVSAAWLIAFPLVFFVSLARLGPIVGVGVRAFLAATARPAACGAVMWAAVLLARRRFDAVGWAPSIAQLALLIALGAAVYFAATLLLNRHGLDEAADLVRRRRAAPAAAGLAPNGAR
jgi:O-antigen/teichoic acid export membrane protein